MDEFLKKLNCDLNKVFPLSELQTKIVKLYYIEKKSISDIAEELKFSGSYIKQILYKSERLVTSYFNILKDRNKKSQIIEVLNLSDNLNSILIKKSILYLEDLSCYSDEQFFKLEHIGNKYANELIAKMKNYKNKEEKFYIVKKTVTILDIAKELNENVEKLIILNNLKARDLMKKFEIGQKIKIG